MNKLDILLVDDNPNFLKAAREVLAIMPNVNRVDFACSAPEALALAARSRPDLVLTDLAMPGMSGFEVIRSLRGFDTPPRIVALTLHESAEYRAAARRCGAHAFVAKREFGALIPSIIADLAGKGDETAPDGMSSDLALGPA